MAYSAGIRTDGTLWAWGYHINGQLGLGDNLERTIPTQVGTDNDWVQVRVASNHTVAIKTDGMVWAWGNNSDGKLGNGTLEDSNIPVCITSVIPGQTCP
jgi:alpha-tubulin suppressor-like RCC1 family protein